MADVVTRLQELKDAAGEAAAAVGELKRAEKDAIDHVDVARGEHNRYYDRIARGRDEDVELEKRLTDELREAENDIVVDDRGKQRSLKVRAKIAAADSVRDERVRELNAYIREHAPAIEEVLVERARAAVARAHQAFEELEGARDDWNHVASDWTVVLEAQRKRERVDQLPPNPLPNVIDLIRGTFTDADKPLARPMPLALHELDELPVAMRVKIDPEQRRERIRRRAHTAAIKAARR